MHLLTLGQIDEYLFNGNIAEVGTFSIFAFDTRPD